VAIYRLVDPLEPPDSHYLRAAEGWLELGRTGEANQELRKINPELRGHPDVLEVRWRACAQSEKWNSSVEIGRALVALDPDRVTGWIYRAYALRRASGGGLQVAWDALLPAVEKFPEVYVVPFNLACYACQMGRLPEARRWLRRAFEIAEKAGIQHLVWLRALDDPDLEPLWVDIGNIEP
jgi:tetratricopeptide (TPR) repeat protein